ncbi:PP2C family protein-serine/threonine phosphatase [Anaeromyxobacter oryzisoli]|uniref:PP2C family protein-serine/threonine phosphatase n=1 Tax=Anaeromyxobacter oryzisoli TaxID=2925408 RepID=UPI001F59850C|nr:PP2C family protein-serine/threonine phosphatase [Anaeromyxobacter sp. SG63]
MARRDRSRPGAPSGRFEPYHQALVHRWCGIVALVAAVLVPAFLLLDEFTMPPGLIERFATYRLGATALVASQVVVIRLTRPSRWSFLHGFASTLIVGGMITWMTVDLGGFDAPYYAGLNLVVAANLLIPWRTAYAVANSLLAVGTYVASNAIWGGPFHPAVLVNNLFFLGSMATAAIVTASARFELIAREFAARTELLEANLQLERSRAELRAARDALWSEMQVAERIQTALLPQGRRVGAYDVAARMVTAAEVGGDYYDILEAGEGRRWIAIGDVSGHGVESGLVMMMTQTSILTLVRENPALAPSEVFHRVNGVLRENISRLGASRYMTLNVVRLEDDRLVVAGKHQDVLVWRAETGAVETVSNEGCWLGVVEDTRRAVGDQAIPMGEGDVALFFTDGATEAMSASGEMYGEARLAEALARVAAGPLDRALERLFEDLAAFRVELVDDVTLLLARRSTAAAAVPSPDLRSA